MVMTSTMTKEKLREQVSAFIDDELPDAEAELVLRRLGEDAELRRAAERYTLLGQVLRNETRLAAGSGLHRRVARLLESEPEHAGGRAQPSRAAHWARAAAGFGVAASVAAVAIFSLRSPLDAPQEMPVAADATSVVPAAPASYTVPGGVDADRPAAPARLTNYLLSHGQYAGALENNGLHRRLVVHEPETLPRSEEGGEERDGAPPE